MAQDSKIEWTHNTMNPWIGCTKISAACDNCYAEEWDKRYEGGAHWGPHADRRKTSAGYWNTPKKWNKQAAEKGVRYRVFCASLADVFDNHKSILPEWRAELFQLIKETPHLDWLLLTKRPQNIAKMLPADWGDGYPNVWLGTTIESQEEAAKRIEWFLSVPAKVHFLSCEPLLTELDLENIEPPKYKAMADSDPNYPRIVLDALRGHVNGPDDILPHKIGWVIAGGESGAEFRPTQMDWFRKLRDQCKEAGVPFLFKQFGGKSQKDIKLIGRRLDGVIHDGYPEVSHEKHI